MVTAQHYLDHYYSLRLPITVTSMTIENKLSPRFFPPEIRPIRSLTPYDPAMPIRIGYFGALRCPIAWSVLKTIAKLGCGRIKVVLRGDARNIPGLAFEAAEAENVEFLGPYLDPEDIAKIYNSVDLVWSAGFHKKKSYRWARSCRYYYAGYFGKPIISESSTEEGAIVANRRIGMVVDLSRPAEAAAAVLNVLPTSLSEWTANLASIPAEDFVLSNEVDQLFGTIRKRSHEQDRELRKPQS